MFNGPVNPWTIRDSRTKQHCCEISGAAWEVQERGEHTDWNTTSSSSCDEVMSRPTRSAPSNGRIFSAQSGGSSLAHVLKGTSLKSSGHVYTTPVKAHFKLCLRHSRVLTTSSEPLVAKQTTTSKCSGVTGKQEGIYSPRSTLKSGFTPGLSQPRVTP